MGTLIFSFRPYSLKAPAPSLGGKRVRYKPVIALTVIGPGGQDSVETLVDSGADDVVFPLHVATRIGMNLSAAFPAKPRVWEAISPLGYCMLL
jgi:hypothetical protein